MHRMILAMSVAGLATLTGCGQEPAVEEAEAPVASEVAGAADGVEYDGGPSETMPATSPGADAIGTATAATSAAAWDRNNNGLFERAEYGAYGDSVFGEWDANDDNRLTRDEFEGRWTAAGWRDAGTAWGAFDDNGDGFLTEDEFFADDEFGEWDANRSAVLENDEWF